MKNLKLITITSLLAIGVLMNCHKREIGGNQANGFILAQLVGGLGKGNCAISINGTGLVYGAVINIAATNGANLSTLSSLYTSAALQTQYKTSHSVTTLYTFTQSEFESATGKTIASIDSNYTAYSLVAYATKYDAFINWDQTKRENAIAYTKTFAESFGPIGDVAIGQTTTANTNYSAMSTYQKLILDSYVDAVAAGAGLGAGETFCDSWTEVFGSTTCSGIIGASNYANYSAAVVSNIASLALPVRSTGTGVLACAKIPKASCSFTGLTTLDRATDVSTQAKRYDLMASTIACKKPSVSVMEVFAKKLFYGAPPELAITGFTTRGTYNNRFSNLPTTGLDTDTQILGEKAYPKFGSLVSLGFGALMPMKDGTTAYGANYATQGANMQVKAIDSCSAIGLGTGPTPTAPNGYAKELSSVQEIVYAFSDNGAIAKTYASISSTNGGQTIYDTVQYNAPTTNDAVACNTALRANTAIPALIGGKLTTISASSGDGEASSLLSLCVYGGADSTARLPLRTAVTGSTSSGLIKSGALPSSAAITSGTAGTGAVGECSASASSAAATFGDAGLKTFTTFPNAN